MHLVYLGDESFCRERRLVPVLILYLMVSSSLTGLISVEATVNLEKVSDYSSVSVCLNSLLIPIF